MKILFIYPDLITKMINFCPAIHILSAVLKREGYQVNMLHINNEHGIRYERELITNLSKGYDLFAITSTSFNYKYANEIAGWLQEAYPETLIILGGYHATTTPEDFKESNFDIFCIGEGEEPMKDLCKALTTGDDWTKIPNLITRFGTNRVRGFMRDMNSLPLWDFEITDTARILKARNGWLSISFSRGCPYECTFCYNHLLKKVELGPQDKMSDYIRKRSAINAVSELESLIGAYDIHYFNIDDDLLTMDKQWISEFAELYQNKIYSRTGIKYVINSRADKLTDEIVKLLSRSGCKEVRLGFETGNETLRNELLRKRTTDQALIRSFAALKKYKVQAVAFAMMGVPGETWETFNDTVQMTIKLKPDLIRMTFLYPYKHTRIYDICIKRGLLKENYTGDNRDLDSPLKFDITDEELFMMRFLFPWYVNYEMYCMDAYRDAIEYYRGFCKPELEKMIPGIIVLDHELSTMCPTPHYRYYDKNPDYFELYDYIEDTI